MKFRIRGALGGGFGGVENEDWQIVEANSLDEAQEQARQLAVEAYQGFEGMHGIRSISDIMEEDGVDEEEAQGTYEEEMETWLDFEAEPVEESANG